MTSIPPPLNEEQQLYFKRQQFLLKTNPPMTKKQNYSYLHTNNIQPYRYKTRSTHTGIPSVNDYALLDNANSFCKVNTFQVGLDVTGSSPITFGAGTTYSIQKTTSDGFGVRQGDSDYLFYFDSAKNTSVKPLHVESNLFVDGGYFEVKNSDGDSGIQLNVNTTSNHYGFLIDVTDSGVVFGSDQKTNSRFLFVDHNDDTIFEISTDSITLTQPLVLNDIVPSTDDTETLSIGTASPTKRWKDIRTYATNSYQIDMSNGIATTSPSLYINSSGFVGIGTTTPATPLHVNGNTTIRGNVYSYSDARIKSNITPLNSASSLHHLRYLSPCSYEYIDKTHGTRRIIGFVAQEVKKTLPESIDVQCEIVPDYYAHVDEFTYNASSHQLLLLLPETSYPIEPNQNLMVWLTCYDRETDTVYEEKCLVPVSGVVRPHSKPFIRVIAEVNVSANVLIQRVFVYGREVSDFHTIDKSMVYTLTTSAVKELDTRQQQHEQRIQLLENTIQEQAQELQTTRTQLADMQEAFRALQEQVNRLLSER